MLFSAGKLAPIFMRGKAKEEDSEPIVVAVEEDPEKARLRKEFLMSGVPEELRRQIATTASNTIIADYPPIPVPNHIAQIVCGDLPQMPIKIKVLLKDGFFNQNLVIGEWKNLVHFDSKYATKAVLPFKVSIKYCYLLMISM